MSKQTPNIGEVGVKSIRLGGMKVDDLPIAEAHFAKEQLPLSEEDIRQNEIAAVRARYPTQPVEAINGRIREARGMAVTFRQRRDEIHKQRQVYVALLQDVKKRDVKIAKLDPKDDKYPDRVKLLNDQYGPWQEDGLRIQLGQFDDSIDRFAEMIEREQKSIDELSELIGECRARDKELARLGA